MISPAQDTGKARLATRLTFFSAGYLIACWAPLIPFVKENLGVNEAQFGLLLLCLGLGSLTSMPAAGVIVARSGARKTAIVGVVVAGAALPILSMANQQWELAAILFVFGASLGALDVAMNVHGSQVEISEKRPLMSGFHALFSLGNLCGATMATGLISMGFVPVVAALACSGLALVVALPAGPKFLRIRGSGATKFAFPRGVVILLSVVTGLTFLVEGAVLDWGALLIIERGIAEAQNAGIGFILFSMAMVASRLAGDFVVLRLGEFRSLIASGLGAVLGITIVVSAGNQTIALFGFFVIGLGAANVAPILFSKAGQQTAMPPALSVASVTTVGYAGHMLGPAFVGFAAQKTSLASAFFGLAVLMMMVPVAAFVLRRDR